MKADAHIHLFKDGFFGAPGSQVGLEEYEQLRSLVGVDEALVVGYEGDERYMGNNAYILELAQSRTWVHPTFYLSSPIPLARGELRDLRARGFAGFSLYLDELNTSLSHWPTSNLQTFGQAGSVVSINASHRSLANARSSIEAMTECSVLVSHFGLPALAPPNVGAGVRERLRPLLDLHNLEHVCVKLSAFYTMDPVSPYRGALPYVNEVLEAFGPSRLMWGSDFSPAMGYGSMQQIGDLPDWLADLLSPDEQEEIAALTLRRVLDRAQTQED